MRHLDFSFSNENIPVFSSLEDLRKKMGISTAFFYKAIFASDFFYKEILIPKRKVGKFRTLKVPPVFLKNMQRWILDNILYFISCHRNATGFIPNKSIVDNALVHVRKKYILKMDIEDFFPSINFYLVREVFIKMHYSKVISNALASLCICEGQLPQGAPTSPYIANLVFIDIDIRISQLCLKHNLNYSRYADDITISGSSNIFWVRKVVEKILSEKKFKVNKDKTVIIKPGDKKQVTGLIVNDQLSVPKSTIRELRKNIYYIKEFGIDSHLNKIKYEYAKEKYIDSLYGTASFIKMISPEKGINFFNELNSIFRRGNQYNSEQIEPSFIDFSETQWTVFEN